MKLLGNSLTSLELVLLINVLITNAKRLEEYDVYKDILKNYNSKVRPADLVNISMSFSLKQIVSIDEKNQLMTSSSYLGLEWNDTRLTWNSSDYSNVTEILVPTNQLWIIDLFVVNIGDANGYVNIASQSLSVIQNTGLIYVIFSLTNLKTRCSLDIKHYPFDMQTCPVIINIFQNLLLG